jgi:ribosomal protein L20
MYPDGLVVPKDEEENACAFSIWFPLTRKYFSNKSQKVVVTKQHTLRGKSWLFMTRTRQEKDLWVMAINAVLDRQEQ